MDRGAWRTTGWQRVGHHWATTWCDVIVLLVSLRVFLDEINIWLGGLRQLVYPPQCGWVIVQSIEGPCSAALSRSVVFDSLQPHGLYIARQAPLSMGFSRQEYWSGLPVPSPGDLPDPGIELRSPTLQEDSLPSEPPGKPIEGLNRSKMKKEKCAPSCLITWAETWISSCPQHPLVLRSLDLNWTTPPSFLLADSTLWGLSSLHNCVSQFLIISFLSYITKICVCNSVSLETLFLTMVGGCHCGQCWYCQWKGKLE